MMSLRFHQWPLLFLLLASSFYSGLDAGCTGPHQLCPASCVCSWEVGSGTEINCQYKGLQAVPDNMPPDAWALDLRGNNITVINEHDLTDCSSLKELDLSSNILTTVHKKSFCDQKNLRRLFLQNNQMTFQLDTVPNGTFKTVTELNELNMHGNRWNLMPGFRYDLLENKLQLRKLSMDVPAVDHRFGTDFSKLTSLTNLYLAGGIEYVRNDTFAAFANLTITHLTLRSSKLKFLDILSFSHFPNIHSLDLSNNRNLGLGPNLSQSWYGLRTSNLTILDLSSVVGQFDYIAYTIPSDFFRYLNDTPLQELYLNVNGLVKIDTSFHRTFPGLQKLSLAYNRFFDYINEVTIDVSPMKNLHYLDISKQSQFPPSTELVSEDRLENRRDHNLLVYFAPNLMYLNLSAAFPASYKIIHNLVWFSRDRQLELIDVSNNMIYELNGQIILHPNISVSIGYLNASNCGLRKLAHNFFPTKLTVTKLDISMNNLGSQYQNDSTGINMRQFNTIHCKEIDMTSNGIRALSAKFFSQVATLEKIILRGNSLSTWQTAVANLVNFTFLDLSMNLIPYLEYDVCQEFDNITKTRSFSLNLAGNPLECACHSLIFLRWMHSTKVEIVGRDNYVCHMSGGLVTLSNLTDIIGSLSIKCSSTTWVVVTGVMCTMLVIVLSLAVVLYRHRWDIRYCFLKFQRQRRQYDSLMDNRDFFFDAFVAYHQNELCWMRHQLLPNVEECENPLNLCIHHRNWLPGPTIEENISFSVENCRKTLALLSKSFLRSGWCEFELEMARLRGFEEDKQIIVVVALEEIPVNRLSRTLVNLRRTHTWLDWTEYEDDRQQFWDLLRRALRA